MTIAKKTILDHEGEGVFAELAILRILLNDGWDGVWVEAFGGTHYLRAMPTRWALKSVHVNLPAEKEAHLKNIWGTAKTTACFDIFAWKDSRILLCEAKRAGKDKLTNPQLLFIEGALACGIAPESMLIVEWSTV